MQFTEIQVNVHIVSNILTFGIVTLSTYCTFKKILISTIREMILYSHVQAIRLWSESDLSNSEKKTKKKQIKVGFHKINNIP